MKNIFTSNFSKKGKHPLSVSISLSPPGWYKGKKYFPLAPTWDILLDYKYGRIDDIEYTKRYLQLIISERQIDPFGVLNDLEDGSILLCYEKEQDFCHRFVVALWLEKYVGIKVIEV